MKMVLSGQSLTELTSVYGITNRTVDPVGVGGVAVVTVGERPASGAFVAIGGDGAAR